MIEVGDLHKRYGAFQALTGVTFSMQRGEVVGFLGPNGAGKTTTMKILTGFLLATSGRATIDGLDVERDSLEVRRRIGYLPESAPLYTDMLAEEYLRFCADVRRLGRDRTRRRIAEVAEQCGIADVLSVPIGHLSKGYRQRVGLAQAVLHEPELMILDEPTSGLDPNQIVEIRRLLAELGRQKTIILSTHILREVEATCNRVLIIHQGAIVADAPPSQLRRGDTVVVRGTGASADEARDAFARAGVWTEVKPIGGDGGGFQLRLTCARDAGRDAGADAFLLARDRKWTLSEIRVEDQSLEEVFHELTGA
jgi:ABC-2 type transport system ATP-binding protein